MTSLLHARLLHVMLPAMDNASVPAKALEGHVTILSARALAVHNANVLRDSDRARFKKLEECGKEARGSVNESCTQLPVQIYHRNSRGQDQTNWRLEECAYVSLYRRQ
jgi:hypothetical protein